MARKVFVSSAISGDEEISEVAEIDPMIALLWPWFLTYFDDWGRAKASPREIKNHVFQANEAITIEVIKKAIQLYSKNLLIVYEVSGKWYMAVPADKWFRWQTHIRRDKRENDSSKIPPPPDDDNAQLREIARGFAESSAGARDYTPSPSPSLSPSPSSYYNNYNNSGHNPYKIFESNDFGKLNEVTSQMIQDLEKDYTTDWVIRAMKVAIKKGEDKKNLGYVEGILKSWKSLDHPEPWTVEKQPEPRQQNSNVHHLPRRTMGSGKTLIPVAQPSIPGSGRLPPEEFEKLLENARELDEKLNGIPRTEVQ